MAPRRPPSEGSPRKLQRLDIQGNSSVKNPDTSQFSPTLDSQESSFSFKNHIISSSPGDIVLDITKYIPAGCLRVNRVECDISPIEWSTCTRWSAFPHPKDISNHRRGSFLGTELQGSFFKSPILKPYVPLHLAGWIRLEFKPNTADHGQIRVYILPDDVGRAAVDRSSPQFRKSFQTLLEQIDIALPTWNGLWSDTSPYFHVDPSLDIQTKPEPSLFEVFNTLPSPKPDPRLVSDPYAFDAMQRLLDNDVPGIRTTMHTYQCRSAALMVQREFNPAQVIDPRLTPQFDQKGRSWYCNLGAGLCYRDPKFFESVRGGICAETMGLGKTLICLALISATLDIYSQIPPEHSVNTTPVRKSTGSLMEMAAARIGLAGLPWKRELERIEVSEGYTFDRCRDALEKEAGHYFLRPQAAQRETRHPVNLPYRKIWLSMTTVVVCPSNLVQQWRAEITKHTSGLKVLYFSDLASSLPQACEIIKYDIILLSKSRFEKEGKDLQSPLKDVHFKRLIVDEGHAFGNTSGASKSMAVITLEALQLSSRWIVSGTPTQGLGAIDRSETGGSSSNGRDSNTPPESHSAEFLKQERKDLTKLGNIACCFLKARPWANSASDGDQASWSALIMQRRHGSKSRGNMHTLRSTLAGMIVKHRPEDVLEDLKLPPLSHKIVYLDGSVQNKLSQNMFAMMIITNAITSERKDVDYFFHPSQRKELFQLVANLREANFFWSGFETTHIRGTVHNAENFLEQTKIPINEKDTALLQEAITMGRLVLNNHISETILEWHEMPMYIENNLSKAVRQSWALDGLRWECLSADLASSPTLMGASMVLEMQKFVASQLYNPDLCDRLEAIGADVMERARDALYTRSRRSRSAALTKAQKKQQKLKSSAKTVATAPTSAGNNAAKRKRGRSLISTLPTSESQISKVPKERCPEQPKSALKQTSQFKSIQTIDSASPLNSAKIISTASAKLSYLMDQISYHQNEEKTIVFYETDNVAYYIAQALECLGIEHLIYDKSLSADRKSQYIVTFQLSEKFRVLLMDISQAAFGLDISSASRVYFVNPVFSPQVEAQALKRAHRIGQTRPVYVETLVLKGSIEEVIVNRKTAMSDEEHNNCKTILDDRTLYDWIRNVKFQPIPSPELSGPDQMAKLQFPHPLFGTGAGRKLSDPDADLVTQYTSPKAMGKGKSIAVQDDDQPPRAAGAKRSIRFVDTPDDDESGTIMANRSATTSSRVPTPTLRVAFAVDEDEGAMSDATAAGDDKDDEDEQPLWPEPRAQPDWESLYRTVSQPVHEPVHNPVDVPEAAGPSTSNDQVVEGTDDWEIPAYADSDEELDLDADSDEELDLGEEDE